MARSNNSGGRKNQQISAVILDFGQVLCLRPQPEEIRRMAEMFQIDPIQFPERYAASRGPYDQGLMTADEYWLGFAQAAGVAIDERDIHTLRRWDIEMSSRIDPTMTMWLASLHDAGLITALLSNMEEDMATYARRNFSWLSYFDHQIFSSDVRLIKPDPAIFRECIRRLGVSPQQTLFVDDRHENVEVAQAIGLTTIQFESVKQLSTDLQKLRFRVLPREVNGNL